MWLRERLISLLVFLLLLAPLGLCRAVTASPAPGRSPLLAQAAPPPPASSPGRQAGEDFAADARLLFRVAACGGDEPLPPNLDPELVRQHCAWLAPHVEKYRKDYREGAERFIARLRAPGLPTTVVYPFGGGDLLSALTTYPEAREITTLSLEHAGDPRRLRSLDRARLAKSLALFRKSISGLFCCDDSTSENLMEMERADIPSQLSFFMVALAVHGFEPVSLRYFTVEPDGSLHYLTREEIDAQAPRTARKLNTVWVSPSFSEAFSDAELTFRPAGAEGAAVLRVHRHIAANLSDQSLNKDPRVLRYLESRGTVCAMTKAASYLLWNAAFVKIRAYLLGRMAFMVSDSTGIPPRFASKAGFVQETYGRFAAPFLDASKEYSEEFVKLWADQPYRPLPFRYGYPDGTRHFHLLITRRPSPAETRK